MEVRQYCKEECERYMLNKKRFNPHRFFVGREEYFKLCEEYVKEHPEYEDPYNAIACFYVGYESKTCPVCGKKIPVSHRESGKDKVCSQECYRTKAGMEKAKERRATTNIKKYGSLEAAYKYANERNKESVQKKYGVHNAGLIPGIKEKRMLTMVERYGATTTLQSEVLKQKVQETNLERYGHISAAATDVVRERIYNTNLKKYGTKNAWSAKQCIEKRVKTRNEHDYENFFDIYKQNWEDAGFEFVDFWFPTSRHFFKVRCKTCGKIMKQYNDTPIHCPICNPIKVSLCEQKVLDLVNSCGFNAEHNNRKILKPQELDIVVPELKLAIEVNGVYWHSERVKTVDYHLNKTKKANKKGYRVIHIYDAEINRAWTATKSLILGSLNKKPFVIDASRCEVREVTPELAHKFAKKYNIKGYEESDVNVGLFYKGRMVSAVGFKKNKKSWLLTYNCELLTFKVQGYIKSAVGFFRAYHKGDIVVMNDRRFTEGEEFIEAGFSLVSHTKPESQYTNGSRMFYVKELTPEIVKRYKKEYDDDKSVEENLCDATHWMRLWDCGRTKLVFKEQE